jgi:hypothetical protein
VQLKTNNVAVQSEEIADSAQRVVALHTREVAGSIPAAPMDDDVSGGVGVSVLLRQP